MNVFAERDFDEQPLKCGNCRWRGTGAEAIVIDLYGLTDNKEVRCPDCDVLLGTLKKDDNPPGESATDLSIQFG